LKVIHHVCVPDFEGECGLPPCENDKPWRALKTVRSDATAQSAVTGLLKSLFPGATVFAPIKPITPIKPEDGPEAEKEDEILAQLWLNTNLLTRYANNNKKTPKKSKKKNKSTEEPLFQKIESPSQSVDC